MPTRRLLVALVATVAVIGGCEGPGLIAQALFPEKIPAVYDLPDRSTAVIVDDPQHLLGRRGGADAVTASAHFHLSENNAVRRTVEPGDVANLRHELGDAYPTTAIDRLGRLLGVRQVVHVRIVQVHFGANPGMLRPEAVVRVKVIDVEASRRLFPDPDQVGASHTLKIKMGAHPQRNEGTAEKEALRRRLAGRIGRDVARLFYRHLPRQPGEPME